MFGIIAKYLHERNITNLEILKSSSKSMQLLFISCLPFCYSPLTTLSRFLSFVFVREQLVTDSNKVGLFSRKNTLVNLFFRSLWLCVFFTGLQIMTIGENEINGLFDFNGEIDVSSGNSKKSDMIIFLQYFYSTVDSFTSTGNNSNPALRPKSTFHILLHIILTVFGRYYFVTFLAFGKNVVQDRLDTMHVNYTKTQTRVLNYMKKAGCHETWLGERKTSYILSTLQGIYQKTKFLESDKILSENVMPGLKRKFNLLEFGNTMRETSTILKGVSDSCIVEVIEKSMCVENYFAGNLVHEVKTKFEGIVVVLEGTCYVDNNQLFIKGDCLYDDFLRNFEVRAFSNCKLGWISLEEVNQSVLRFYQKDKELIEENLRAAIVILKEESLLNPIRNILDEEERKKAKRKEKEDLEKSSTLTQAKYYTKYYIKYGYEFIDSKNPFI